MKNILLSSLAVAAGLLLIPRIALGHHGLAQFDQKAVVTLKGTVTDFHFVNPHSVVEFDVKDDKYSYSMSNGSLVSSVPCASLPSRFPFKCFQTLQTLRITHTAISHL